MKNILRNILKRAAWAADILPSLVRIERKIDAAGQAGPELTKGEMLLLREAYSKSSGCAEMENLSRYGFRNHSQNDEDGILWYIFSRIGIRNRRCVEICAGDGIQCNTANLIINDGWEGLLFDGNKEQVEGGVRFYSQLSNTRLAPPLMEQAWITAANVNGLLEKHGFSGEVDLLSLDVDGVDYWIWKALDIIRPRVVVAEVQVIWGTDRACTVPYADDFKSPLVEGFGVYSGGSLPAFVKLGKEKGYRLIGCNRLGFNAFFLRDDICPAEFPEADPSRCLDVPFVRWARKRFLALIKDKEWIDI